MPLINTRSVRNRQPSTAGARLRALRPVVAFNWANGLLPPNLSPRIPGVEWGASTNSGRGGLPDGSVGLYSTASTVVGQVFGIDRSLDGFSPASSPAWFAWTMQYRNYVNQGSASNVIWQYGSLDAATGFWARTTSANGLLVQLANTEIDGGALIDGEMYHCVCGRDAAGTCWLWVNGRLLASGSGATAADSAAAYQLFLIGDATSGRTFQGRIGVFAAGSDNPSGFGIDLSRNVYALFEPSNQVLWFAATGGGTPALDDSGSFPGFEAQSNPLVISVW